MKRAIYPIIVAITAAVLIAAVSGIFQNHSPSPISFEHRETPGENVEGGKPPQGEGEKPSQGGGGGQQPGKKPCSCQKISAEGGNPAHTPLFEVVGAPMQSFMRANVGVIYENGFWQKTANPRISDYEGGDLSYKFTESLDYRTGEAAVKPLSSTSGFVPVFSHTTRVENFGKLKHYPDLKIFRTDSSFTHLYEVDHRVYSFREELLRQAEFRKVSPYLQLPSTVTPRTVDLAHSIVSGIENPYERAKAIESYLKKNYVYDENYRRAPEGHDPVDWFLFEERRGVCANFNSAFAVLARAVDIPTRVVSGYGGLDTGADYQIIYGDQAHLRAEVLFEEFGWVPFDATGSREPPEKISTETVTTDASRRGIKGTKVRVRGRVTDEEGRGVGSLEVLLYLKEDKDAEAPSCAKGQTEENGYFDITFEIAENIEVGEYWLVAHTPGNSKYKESWSDPPLTVLSDTQLSLSIPERHNLNHPLEISGALRENTGGALPNRKISISIEKHGPKAVVTDENGEFSITRRFSESGNYLITGEFDGTEYYLSSSGGDNVSVARVSIQENTGSTLVRGRSVLFSGRAKFGDGPLAGTRIQIQIENFGTGANTGPEGRFDSSQKLPGSIDRGPALIRYSVPSLKYTENQRVTVKASTRLKASAPNSTKTGENFTVEASLVDGRGNPLDGKNISLYWETAQAPKVSKETNTNGKTTFEIRAPESAEAENLQLELRYDGSEEYAPSSNDLAIMLEKPAKNWNIPWLLVGLVVIPAVIGLYLWRSDRSLKANEKVGEIIQKIEKGGKGVIGAGEVMDAEDAIKLHIEFPQIKEDLPDVWGVGEEFEIACRLTGSSDRHLKGGLRLLEGEEIIQEAEIETGGGVVVSRTFEEKGTKQLTAEFEGDSKKVEASEEVRIVNYREEIISQYNSFLDVLERKEFKVGEDTTPIELLGMISKKVDGADGAADVLVRRFEIAEYSYYEVTREDFVDAVRAKNELEGKLAR